MKTCDSVIDAIGNTPMIRLNSFDLKLNSKIYGKVEGMNPGGSVKDRAALYMIKNAENEGLLNKEMPIIEPTSGNTGIGLAMIGAKLGYHCVIVMPDSMSKERISLMKAFGAEVVLTPGKDGMSGAVEKAEELASKNNGFIPSQFSNLSNRMSHIITTASEILEQLPNVDYVIAGIGTGGTATGLAEGFRKYCSKAKVIGVEPAESPLITKGKSGSHGIQGIGANFIPDLFNKELLHSVVTVKTETAIDYARKLARQEGILAGISSGAALAVAVDIAQKNNNAEIVAIFPDRGDRYISTGIFD